MVKPRKENTLEFTERVKNLIEKMPKMSTRLYVDESTSLIADLLETLELAEENGGIIVAERDNLKTDIVRIKMHLESAERAAKANGTEVERLETELCRYYFADGSFMNYATPELALEARQQAAKDMKQMKEALAAVRMDSVTWHNHLSVEAKQLVAEALAESV